MNNLRMAAGFGLNLVIWSLAFATVNWQPVYKSDFSTDPGWITNAPGIMRWDPVREQYHLERSRTGQEYTYISVPYSRDLSYKLEFDIQVVRTDWAGEVPFGLGDAKMRWDKSPYWGAIYSRGDDGRNAICQYTSDTSSGSFPYGYDFPYDLNKWYHNVLVYMRETETLMWEVIPSEGGAETIVLEWRNNLGTFEGIDRLFCGSLGIDYSSGTGEAYIDNVSLEVIPEPATVLLLGFGGLALLRKRKA
jgi:hypothetical protein